MFRLKNGYDELKESQRGQTERQKWEADRGVEGLSIGRVSANYIGVLLEMLKLNQTLSLAGGCRGEGLDQIQTNKGMNGQVDGWDEKLEGRMGRWMDRWIGGWMGV